MNDMNVTIYGRENCTFCQRSKELCDQYSIPYQYINIRERGIGVNELSEICGEEVTTVPQIFINGIYHPGGFTSFNDLIRSKIQEEIELEDMTL